ncbi:MAG: nucleotidyltransferase domain-containing protein [Chloroflexota bacterium]
MGIAERWEKFRELPPNIEQALGKLIPLFENEGVLLAYLFGSLSKGRAGHDVDLAILTGGTPVFRLREAISECLGTERVDLVDLRSASPVLCFEVIRTGRPLYVADELCRERFELATLHLYRDTAPLRRQQREYLKRRMARWSSDGKPLRSG